MADEIGEISLSLRDTGVPETHGIKLTVPNEPGRTWVFRNGRAAFDTAEQPDAQDLVRLYDTTDATQLGRVYFDTAGNLRTSLSKGDIHLHPATGGTVHLPSLTFNRTDACANIYANRFVSGLAYQAFAVYTRTVDGAGAMTRFTISGGNNRDGADRATVTVKQAIFAVGTSIPKNIAAVSVLGDQHIDGRLSLCARDDGNLDVVRNARISAETDDPAMVGVRVVAAPAQTADLQHWLSDDATTTLARVSSTGQLEGMQLIAGPGTVADSNYYLHIEPVMDDSVTGVHGLHSELNITGAATPHQYPQTWGAMIITRVPFENPNPQYSVIGTQSIATHAGTGEGRELGGAYLQAYSLGSASYQFGTYAVNAYIEVGGSSYTPMVSGAHVQALCSSSQNIPTVAAVRAHAWHTGSGTVTNAIGVRVQSPTNGGPVTNRYGILVYDQTHASATNVWGLAVEGTAVKSGFAGRLGVGTLNPATDVALDVSGNARVLGKLALGTAGVPSNRTWVDLNETVVDAGGHVRGMVSNITLNPSTAPAGFQNNWSLQGTVSTATGDTYNHTGLYGIGGTGSHSGTGTVGTVAGLTGTGAHNGTGAVTTLVGLDGTALIYGSGVPATAIGVRAYINHLNANAGQATPLVAGMRVTFAGNGNITTAYGLEVQAPLSTGAIGTMYGLYIANQNRTGTSSYNLYSMGATSRNVLEGSLQVGAGIDLPTAASGVIMTSPNGTRYRMTVSDAGTPVFTAV